MFDTEKFIVEIEKRPAIYDVNRSEYNDRNAKMTAWDEVCQVMVPNWLRMSDEERNVEEKNLRSKWRNIRDYFTKELKLQRTQKYGLGGRKRKKYMYFDQLLFLKPTLENKRKMRPRRQTKKLPPTDIKNNTTMINHYKSEESDGEMDNPVIEEYDVPLTTNNPALANREYLQPGASFKMCHRYPKQICETTFNPFDNEIHDILTSPNGQRVTMDEEDYDKMFLLSLLPIIRQVPDEKKLDVRIQMQQVLALALRVPDANK